MVGRMHGKEPCEYSDREFLDKEPKNPTTNPAAKEQRRSSTDTQPSLSRAGSRKFAAIPLHTKECYEKLDRDSLDALTDGYCPICNPTKDTAKQNDSPIDTNNLAPQPYFSGGYSKINDAIPLHTKECYEKLDRVTLDGLTGGNCPVCNPVKDTTKQNDSPIYYKNSRNPSNARHNFNTAAYERYRSTTETQPSVDQSRLRNKGAFPPRKKQNNENLSSIVIPTGGNCPICFPTKDKDKELGLKLQQPGNCKQNYELFHDKINLKRLDKHRRKLVRKCPIFNATIDDFGSDEESDEEKEQYNTMINDLPEAILVKIFSYFKIPILTKISRTCRKWRRLSFDIDLWTVVDLTPFRYQLDFYKIIKVVRLFLIGSIRNLSLQEFSISASVVREIARCNTLRSLNLDSCLFIGKFQDNFVVDSFPSSLCDLSMRHTSGAASVMNVVCPRLVSVKQFSASNKVFDGYEVEELFASLCSVQVLNISNSLKIDCKAVRLMALYCGNLRCLCLKYCCNFTGEGMGELIKECSGLEELTFNGTELKDEFVIGLNWRKTRIRKLQVSWCRNITEEGLQSMICDLEDLVWLKVTSCAHGRALTDELMDSIATSTTLKHLKGIDFSFSRILTNEGVLKLACLKSLKLLTLSNCSLLTQAVLPEIEKKSKAYVALTFSSAMSDQYPNIGVANFRAAEIGAANIRGANLGAPDIGRLNFRGNFRAPAAPNLRGPNLGGPGLGAPNAEAPNYGPQNFGPPDFRLPNFGPPNFRAPYFGPHNFGPPNFG